MGKMTTYKYKFDDDENVGSTITFRKNDRAIECWSCGSIAPLANFPMHKIDPNRFIDESKDICEICATSMIAVAAEYPDQYRGELNTMKAIAVVGNLILDAITNRKANQIRNDKDVNHEKEASSDD